jgi:hypothetical protein
MKREDILQARPSKEDIARAVGFQALASTPGDILTAFGLIGTGILLGAGLALLFARKAGHAIRQDIAEKVGEFRKHLRAPTPQSATSANPPSA